MQKESILVVVGILVVSVVLLFAVDWLGVPTGKAIEFQGLAEPTEDDWCYISEQHSNSPRQSLCVGNDLYECKKKPVRYSETESEIKGWIWEKKTCEYGCIPPGIINERLADGTFSSYQNQEAFCNNCPINSECSGNDVKGCIPTPSGPKYHMLTCPRIQTEQGCYVYTYVTRCVTVKPVGFFLGGAMCECKANFYEAQSKKKGCENIKDVQFGCPPEKTANIASP